MAGWICRSVVFLTLFSLVMGGMFVVGGYQHFQDDSLSFVLSTLMYASSTDALLCALLFITSIIAAIRDNKRLRYVRNVFIAAVSFALSCVLLCASLAIKLASAGR